MSGKIFSLRLSRIKWSVGNETFSLFVSLSTFLSTCFLFKRVTSSVEDLGRQTQTTSDDHSTYQVRTQNVDGTSTSFPSLFKIR